MRYEFSLPTKADKVPTGPDWLHEVKNDRYRMMLIREQDRVRAISRGGYDWTPHFPLIVAAAFEGTLRMATTSAAGATKFDRERAGEYEKQSRIALAGYDACHELSACMLVAALGAGTTASILVVGAGGTAQEIITVGRLEPNWRFTAIDPAEPMLDLAVQRLKADGLAGRTDARLGYVEDLPADAQFDAATLIGVLHHLPGTEPKVQILESIATRLKPGAPLILACNHYSYASQPLLLAAWGERWRMQGASADEVKAKLGKILQGADPPHSEAAVTSLLDRAGFGQPIRFFASLFWGAWLARRVINGSAPVTTQTPT